MRRIFSVTGLVLLAAGVVFGGTEVATPDVETPAPKDTNAFITNDFAHPVPVVTQGTVNVNVMNGSLPVQVQELRRPFQRDTFTDNWGTGRFRSFGYDIPDGKMLVVEMVTVTAAVESGQKVRAQLSFQSGPLGGDDFRLAFHTLALERIEGFGPLDQYTTTRSIAGYAGGHGGVIITVERNSTTGQGGRVEVSIEGYLIDAPIAAAM